jgi:hypothetical protein
MTDPRSAWTIPALLLVLTPAVSGQKILKDQTALLRQSPKHFVTVVQTDTKNHTVELQVEGKKGTETLTVEPDAEVKIHGTWGRLDQLVAGDRAWVWMHKAKKGHRARIFVIADEISEQEIHGLPYEVTGADAAKKRVFLRRKYGKETKTRELDLDASITVATQGDLIVFSPTGGGSALQPKIEVKPGDRVYIQTAGGKIRLLLSPDVAAELRHKQELVRRADLRGGGLPTSVAANHPFAGEIEVMVDHEAMRWARHQQPGVEVTLMLDKPVKGVLRHVEGWHEKTRLRIATRGPDLADIRPGDRIRIKVPEPPPEVLDSELPVGIGRAKGRDKRIEWFLANTYCSCSIAGDGCTGMFYTLASCNPTRCGMPKRIKTLVGDLIDKGMKDKDILAELRKTRGPMCLKPHLLR